MSSIPGFGRTRNTPARGGELIVTVTLDEYAARPVPLQQLKEKVKTDPMGNVDGEITRKTLLLTDERVKLTGVNATSVRFTELSLIDQRTIDLALIEKSGYSTLPDNCKVWSGFITPVDRPDDVDKMAAFLGTIVIVTVDDDFRLLLGSVTVTVTTLVVPADAESDDRVITGSALLDHTRVLAQLLLRTGAIWTQLQVKRNPAAVPVKPL